MTTFGSVDTREDPALSHNFLIALLDAGSALAMSGASAIAAINDAPAAGFSECSGLEMTLEIEEHKNGGQNGTVLKFPTRTSWSNVVLKRGLGVTSDLWDWYYSFVEGRGTRRDGVIVLQNARQSPHTIWSFSCGLPAKYTGPSMNAQQSNVAIETLEIAHEGLAIVPKDGAGTIEIGPFISEVF
jgi:phage tail-like protein